MASLALPAGQLANWRRPLCKLRERYTDGICNLQIRHAPSTHPELLIVRGGYEDCRNMGCRDFLCATKLTVKDYQPFSERVMRASPWVRIKI